MISIKTIQGDELDLLVDLKLSIQETSVFEGKQGSYSLPLELPYTRGNVALLDLPSNIARKQSFTTSVDVIISAGAWVRYARLEVNEVTYNESIVCTLFLKESPFYNKIENVLLVDVFKDKGYYPFPSHDREDRVLAILTKLNRVMIGLDDADYYVFPVCVEITDEEDEENSTNLNKPRFWKSFKILNQQTTDGVGYAVEHLNWGGIPFFPLEGNRVDKDKNGNIYDLPYGYGVTPFLKFNYILSQLFLYLGYELEDSLFNTDESFKRMCLLNNTIDAIVDGKVDYAQLVPNVEVLDFLSFVENSFGCEFLVNEVDKKITPVFFNDLLNERASGDLSNKYKDYPTVSLKQKETVKLKVLRNISNVDTIKYDTQDEIFEEHGPAVYLGSIFEANIHFFNKSKVNGTRQLYHLGTEGAFVLFIYELLTPGSSITHKFYIEKNTMDYYSMDNGGYIEKDLGFEVLKLIPVPTAGKSAKTLSPKTSIPEQRDTLGRYVNYSDWYSYYDDGYNMKKTLTNLMPMIDGYRHLKTVYRETYEGENEIIKEEKEKEVDLPIIPCFYAGKSYKPDYGRDSLKLTYFGTNLSYDNATGFEGGAKWGTFDLTPSSLYKTFWQKFDDVVRSSYHTISGPALFSINEVMNLRFDKQYLLDNQPVLPISIQYEVSDSGIKVTDLTVRTTKVYE